MLMKTNGDKKMTNMATPVAHRTWGHVRRNNVRDCQPGSGRSVRCAKMKVDPAMLMKIQRGKTEERKGKGRLSPIIYHGLPRDLMGNGVDNPISRCFAWPVAC
jgi:hypothetical protein